MARCRKEHNFGEWHVYTYDYKHGFGEVRVEDDEEYIKKKKKELEEKIKEYKKEKVSVNVGSLFFFGKISWKRFCKKCNKQDWEYLGFDERPVEKKVEVKKTSSLRVEKNKKYSRPLGGKEESMSKGWRKR